MTGARVLVADDDEHARAALEKVLRAAGFEISTAPDGGRRSAERVVTPVPSAPYARRHDTRKWGIESDSGAMATTGGGVAA